MYKVKIDKREDEESISDDEEDLNNIIMLEGSKECSGPDLDPVRRNIC